MSAVSMDGQGFLASGRRIVLCSGAVSYSRIARESWGDALDGITRLGLNAVEAPIVWRDHEPREGSFAFKEQLDLAQFVREAGGRGLWVILRFGVVADHDLDFGGLPSWLNRKAGPDLLRSAAPEFLDRAGKLIAKACAQVKGLQATGETPTESSCVIAVQAEHGYDCGDPAQAGGYLTQIHRHIRESGISVPVLNANNLFAYVDGQVETWRGGSDLLASMRQLRLIEPNDPLHVSHLPVAPVGMWNETPEAVTRPKLARRLCQALASGSSFNIERACPGDRIGFTSGRTLAGHPMTDTSNERLLDPDGRPNERSSAVRRVCLFATHFAQVLGSVSVGDDHACGAIESPGATVIERRGSLGTAVFVFADPTVTRGSRRVGLLMHDGTRCDIDPGADGVGWVLAGVSLGGRATLDLCTASAVALVGSVFVCTGPGGSGAEISINGSSRGLDVPKGKTPDVFTLEDITVVCVNEAHLDAVRLENDAVVLENGGKRIAADGTITKFRAGSPASASRAPALTGWSVARPSEYVRGTADRFAVIKEPASMEEIGVGEGYGWIRVKLNAKAANRKKLSLYESADRVHIYRDGAFAAVLGRTPGGTDSSFAMPLSKGSQTISMLVDNLGRRGEGNMTGERKGVFGHLYETGPVKSTAKQISRVPIEALRVRSPLMGVDRGELIDARRMQWTFSHLKKSPICITLDGIDVLAFVFLNEALLGVVDPKQRGRWVLDQATLNRGKNELEVAVLGDASEHLGAMKGALTLIECTVAVTEKAEWAYAKWETPFASDYEDVPAAALKGKAANDSKGEPAWWRCDFSVADTGRALRFDATGLSKGQLFINGHNAGRYWVGTHEGKAVAGSAITHVPAGWLNVDAPNELLVFDEHGFAPGKCKLSYA